MTEQEWLKSTNFSAMLRHCKVSERKYRLMACAFVRTLCWQLLLPESKTVIEVAEKFADGKATKEELQKARNAAAANTFADEAAYAAAAYEAAYYAAAGVYDVVAYNAIDADIVDETIAIIIRDIVGNPFKKPSTIVATTPDIKVLANSWYNGDSECLSILADALEEQGSDLAQHLRKGHHVKGCWAIDLILGNH